MGKVDRIIQLLSERPGIKAKEIANLLDLPKKEVNSILYGPLRGRVRKDELHYWLPKQMSSQAHQPELMPKPSYSKKNTSDAIRTESIHSSLPTVPLMECGTINEHSINQKHNEELALEKEVVAASLYRNKPDVPESGDIVRIRMRTYLVEAVKQEAGGHCIQAVCLDDDAQGQHLEAVWELELDTKILDETVWKSIGQRGFDNPRYFSAYIHALKWNCVTATNPRLFQAPSCPQIIPSP